MKSRNVFGLCVIVLGLCLVGNAVSFQRETGLQDVTGTVVDTNGAAVAHVKVVLTAVKKKTDRTTITDKTGFFHFPFIPVGEYTVRVDDPAYESASVHFQVTSMTASKVHLKVSARQHLTFMPFLTPTAISRIVSALH